VEHEVGECDHSDNAGKQQTRCQISEVKLLGNEVACRGSERKGKQDGEPIENFTPRREDRVDR
jgi:hypothetical protein